VPNLCWVGRRVDGFTDEFGIEALEMRAFGRVDRVNDALRSDRETERRLLGRDEHALASFEHRGGVNE
jgi:hypothetical protein